MDVRLPNHGDFQSGRWTPDLREDGFSFQIIEGGGAFRLPPRPAIGLWRQSEGAGRLHCPIAGLLDLSPGSLALHDASHELGGQHEMGARALEVELSHGLIEKVGRREFATKPSVDLAGGARVLCDPPMMDLIDTLYQIAMRGLRTDRSTLRALARALATRVLSQHLIAADRRTLDARLLRVTQHIGDHIEETLRLAELAEIAGLSTFHFSRVFGRHMGQTVQAYIREVRIDRARTLLAEGDLPLAEIAFACGFAHQSHFTATFREATGRTPGAYRARLAAPAGTGDSGDRARS